MTEDKIVEFLDKFSAKVAEVSGQGFEYVAQYNATAAWTSIGMFIATLLVLTPSFFFGLKGLDEASKKENSDLVAEYGIFLVVCGLVLIITACVGMISMPSWIATIQNPEGSVIQDILRKL